MGMHDQKGFTIVETLLFLGISGLLAITLLAGWTTMINTQRYRDSVKTLQTFLQQQYNLVQNVQNGRNGSTGCVIGPDGRTSFSNESDVESNDLLAKPPGQSNCIAMGRYIHIKEGSLVAVYPIIGINSSELSAASASNQEVILAREPVEITDEISLAQNELNIPWQAQVAWPKLDPRAGAQMDVAIALVRNPESGTIHTYAWDNATTLPSVRDVITSPNSGDTNLCLDPGVPMAGGWMGVRIRAGASGQSAVQMITDSEGVC